MDPTVLHNLKIMGMEKHSALFKLNQIDFEVLKEMSPTTMASVFHGRANDLHYFEKAHKIMTREKKWEVPPTQVEIPVGGSSFAYQDISDNSFAGKWSMQQGQEGISPRLMKQEDPLADWKHPDSDTEFSEGSQHQSSESTDQEGDDSQTQFDDDETQFERSEVVTPGKRKTLSVSENETPLLLKKARVVDEKNVVEEYLLKTCIGKVLLATSKQRKLKQTDKVKLSEIVVVGEIGADCEKGISAKRLQYLAECIKELCPKENASSYYTPRVRANGLGTAVQPKGALYDKYHNVLRRLRKAGLRGSIRDTKENDEDSFGEDEGLDVNQDLEYLEKNSLARQSITVEKWKATAARRHLLLLNVVDRKSKTRAGFEKIGVYLDQYPCLKQPWGLQLLLDDFHSLFENKYHDVILNWSSVSGSLKTLVKDLIVNDCETQNGKTVRLLQAIPALFKQPLVPYGGSGKIPKTEKRVHWKPNRQESTNAFLLHAEDTASLSNQIRNMKAKCEELKQTLQPFAAVVGRTVDRLTDYYVILDDLWYQVESPLAAVDSCFKVFHALHCFYPVQSSYAWIFLQKALYKFSTAWDLQVPVIEDRVDEFNSVVEDCL